MAPEPVPGPVGAGSGRFFWASTSDYIGRKNTYFVFMVLGFALYCLVPYMGAAGSVEGFVLCFLVIISMYGGGFSTVPAYLKDMFGTRYVGAIHGLLLTAWSMAGIFGPVLVNYIREYNVTHGVPKAQAYNVTMYIMAGLLVVGFLCNLFVKAVHHRFHMKPEGDTALATAAEARPHHQADARIGRARYEPRSFRNHHAAAVARVGIRRHSARAWRVGDHPELAEAVSIGAEISATVERNCVEDLKNLLAAERLRKTMLLGRSAFRPKRRDDGAACRADGALLQRSCCPRCGRY